MVPLMSASSASAQCVGCGADYNKAERARMQHWREWEHIHERLEKMDRINHAGGELVNRMIEHHVSKGSGE